MGFLSSLLVLSALFSFVISTPATKLERGVSIPPVIKNYSGTARPNLPNQIASAPRYAPQLPSRGNGWEEWVLVVQPVPTNQTNQTENPIFFARWSCGNPASLNSRLEDGLFIFRANFNNGTTWVYTVNGTLNYSNVGGVKTWSIGDNKLIFDGATRYWNHSMVHPGFSFQSFTNMYALVHISISICPTYPHMVT